MNIKKRIIKILKSTLNEENIDETISQKNSSKWDSLKHLTIIVEIETEFDIEFEPDEIENMTDYSKIEQYINAKI
tara:strand:+ start:2166 stop:2390 length:225 start_codon:yes stop_codon:yes gene_type:complete